MQGHIFFIMECPGAQQSVQNEALFFVILIIAFLGNIGYNKDTESEMMQIELKKIIKKYSNPIPRK